MPRIFKTKAQQLLLIRDKEAAKIRKMFKFSQILGREGNREKHMVEPALQLSHESVWYLGEIGPLQIINM